MSRQLIRFRLRGCLVDASLNRITTSDATVQIEPKIMQVLVLLAEHAGELVTREQLMERVWSGVFVTDDALNRAIRELRRLFDDDPNQPQVIETIRKRGYRLLATPEVEDGAPGAIGVRAASMWRRAVVPIAAVAVVATAVGAAAVHFRLGPTRSDPAERMRFVPLTTTPGNEVDPALSPSGRLAFVARGPDGRSHIFVKGFDANDTVQVTRGEAREAAPTWAPDDRHFAFARLAATRPLDCQIWIGDADGGAERRVGACGSDEAIRMSWSPDGQSIAIAAGGATLAAPLHLEVVAVATADRAVLTSPPPAHVGDQSPAFSPDGRHVAFVRSVADSIGDIFIVSRDSVAPPRRVTFDNADVLGLDWEPDGQHIVFSSDRAGGINLWRVAVSGGEPALVAGGGGKLKHPSVARLAGVVAYEDWHYEINLTQVAAAPASPAPTSVSATSDQWNFFPQISPDQNRLAFESTRSGAYELWLSDRRGSNARQITHSAVYKSIARWSPDGRRLVFATRTGARWEAVIFDVTTAESRVIARDESGIIAPSWSHDGRAVYFGSRRDGSWQVWAVAVDGGDPRKITSAGGYAALESLDGRWLYYTSLSRRGLWRRALDGTQEQLLSDAVQADEWANFGVVDRGVFFLVQDEDGDPQVMMLDSDAAAPRPLARLADLAWSGVALSRDAAQILYARADRRESNITGIRFDPPRTAATSR